MAVHAVFECALADLIQPAKLKGHTSTIGEDEPVKPDGEPFLILADGGRRGSDHARAAVCRIPCRILCLADVERKAGHGNPC